jgi:mannose-6-phosphate isomerase-like protein (cupin superfamily)
LQSGRINADRVLICATVSDDLALDAEHSTSIGADTVNAINLAEKLAMFNGYWQPRTIGQFNGHDLMVVKVKGEFVWHKHDDTDDFFLVLKGRVTIRMREGSVTLGPGELFVVPKGLEHCPVAEEEAHVLLIEPTGTPNTGIAETAAPRRVI